MTTGPHHPADETADERSLLLSAYVDGDATPDERARVEADPALQSDARRLLEIKAAVADVPPPAGEARSRLLGAALAELQTAGGAQPAAASPGSAAQRESNDATAGRETTPPVPSRWRTRRPWLLQAAAVVAVVAAGGIAVAVWQSGSDDGDRFEAGDAAVQDEVDEASGEVADDAEDADAAWEADDDAATMEAAPEAADEDAPDMQEPADLDDAEEFDEQGADDRSDVLGSDVTDRPDATASAATLPRRLRDHDDLIRWYSDLEAADPSRTNLTVGRRCGTEIVGEAIFDGIEVVIAVDDEEITAYNADTCDVETVVAIP